MATEQRVYVPNSKLIDNRRNVTPVEERFITDSRVTGLHDFLKLTPTDLKGVETVIARGGDGTRQGILRLIDLDDPPVIVSEGGASAGTHDKGLEMGPSSPIPDSYQKFFPSDAYAAYTYYPPLLEHEGKIDPCTYLVGVGHLGIRSTQFKEGLAKLPLFKDQVSLAYIAAGIISLPALIKRINPSHPELKIGHDVEKLEEKYFAALEAFALPILATFKMKAPVPENKIRVLSIGTNDRASLLARYAMALVIGGLVPYGIDLAAQSGIVNIRDVDEFSALPDQARNPNACVDGQLEKFSGRIYVRRSKKPVQFIIKKSAA